MMNDTQTAQKPAGDINIKLRDRTSLELKIRYLLKREVKTKNKYNIKFFFFFPHSFNINTENFGSRRFYSSLKLYMRFDTPLFKIDELLDEESDSSPLVRLENTLSHSEKKNAAVSANDFVYENKLLGCVYKSLLRDSLASVLHEKAIEKGDKHLRDNAIKTAERLHTVAERYHQLREKADKVLTNPKSLIKDCYLMYSGGAVPSAERKGRQGSYKSEKPHQRLSSDGRTPIAAVGEIPYKLSEIMECDRSPKYSG
jgi:hypothetical protein